MRLYIIGNGFDLHHGLKTSYGAYKEYLKNKNRISYDEYENIVRMNNDTIDAWTDIENSLNLNYAKILSSYVDRDEVEALVKDRRTSILTARYNESEDYYGDDESDSLNDVLPGMGDMSIVSMYGQYLNKEVELATEFIYDFTGIHLYNWLKNIDYSKVKADLLIEKDAKFVSFNYIDTLEDYYDISSENVLHIHGRLKEVELPTVYDKGIMYDDMEDLIDKLDDYSDEAQLVKKLAEDAFWDKKINSRILNGCIREHIQFGAAIDYRTVTDGLKKLYEGLDGIEIVANELIRYFEDFIDASTKKIEENYDILDDFIDDDIDSIVIMGHTLMGPDLSYYKDIIVPKYRDIHWTFYNYGTDDSKIVEFVSEMGIKDYDIENW